MAFVRRLGYDDVPDKELPESIDAWKRASIYLSHHAAVTCDDKEAALRRLSAQERLSIWRVAITSPCDRGIPVVVQTFRSARDGTCGEHRDSRPST